MANRSASGGTVMVARDLRWSLPSRWNANGFTGRRHARSNLIGIGRFFSDDSDANSQSLCFRRESHRRAIRRCLIGGQETKPLDLVS